MHSTRKIGRADPGVRVENGLPQRAGPGIVGSRDGVILIIRFRPQRRAQFRRGVGRCCRGNPLPDSIDRRPHVAEERESELECREAVRIRVQLLAIQKRFRFRRSI